MPILTPAVVFRRYEVDGVPDSGDHDPLKSEIIQLFDSLFGTSRGGWVVTGTRSELLTVTPEDETDGGVVLNDPNPAYNGYYERDSGTWLKGRGFPDTFAELEVVGGSADAIVTNTSGGVSPADVKVFFMEPTATNTGATTLSVNGSVPKPLNGVDGDPVGAGLLQAGRIVLLTDKGADFRLLSDPNVDGAVAAAAAEADRARDEADRAEQAVADAAAMIVPDRGVTEAKLDEAGSVNDLVLSLTSGVPASQADVAGATSVYVIPAGGGMAEIYNGSGFKRRAVASQLQVTLNTTAHPGGDSTSGRNFDVFVAYSGGAVIAGTGPSWEAGGTGGTLNARGTGSGSTEIEVYQGRIVNKNAIVLTNGTSTYNIAARQALLVGTFRTTANGQTEDSAWRRYVSQALRPMLKKVKRDFSDSNYNYTSATPQQWANNTANRVRVVQSLAGRLMDLTMYGSHLNASSSSELTGGIGIGVNALTDSGTQRSQGSSTNARAAFLTAKLVDACPLGFATYAALHRSDGTNALTFISTSTSGNMQNGLSGTVVI